MKGAQGEAKLTFVVPCKGRLGHLKASLPAMIAQDGAQVIVVDSSCPDGAAAWVSGAYPDIQVVMIDDGGAFNLSRCRNAGLKAADTAWVCFVDADVVLSDTFSRDLIPRLEAGAYHRFARRFDQRHLGGTCVVAREDALRVGGYDEVFEGWGGEDWDFHMRLELAGVRPSILPASVVRDVFTHSDEMRAAFYAQKDLRLSHAIAALYRLAKFNFIMHGGPTFLTLADRRRLYALAQASVTQAVDCDAKSARLLLALPIEHQFRPALGAMRQSLAIEFDTSGIPRKRADLARLEQTPFRRNRLNGDDLL